MEADVRAGQAPAVVVALQPGKQTLPFSRTARRALAAAGGGGDERGGGGILGNILGE